MTWYRVEFYIRDLWDGEPPEKDAADFMAWLRQGQYYVDALKVRPARDDTEVHYGAFIADNA